MKEPGSLCWHIFNNNGSEGEYATDAGGDGVYLVTGNDEDGWTLYEQHPYSHDMIGRKLVESVEVWCFDKQEQARNHAEVLYREKEVQKARSNIRTIKP